MSSAARWRLHTEITALLFDLFAVFLAATLAAELSEPIDQTPVIGELLAGALIGAYVLGLIGTPDSGLIQHNISGKGVVIEMTGWK